MLKVKYLDFDLRIERQGNNYRALILDSPAGQASAEFDLLALNANLDKIIHRLGHIRSVVRRLESPQTETAREFGAELYRTVFCGDVRSRFDSSRSLLKEGTGLRVRLHLSDAPELADIPWEFLYDQGAERFLALSIETPLVRYLDLPQPTAAIKVTPPLKVLVMMSSPANYMALDVEREWNNLKTALSDLEAAGLVQIARMENPTLQDLHRQLRRGTFHVFHFIGHGAFDASANDGYLLFQDENGLGRPVTGHELGTLLYDYRSSLRLAVLNACEGARTSASDPFAGTAQSLVQQGIPAVIAMQFEITDRAAIILAREFYSALAEGFPVDAALTEARKSIYAQSREMGANVEWGTPVLYMRSPDGYIFNLSAAPQPVSAPVSALAPARATPPKPVTQAGARPVPKTKASAPARVTEKRPLPFFDQAQAVFHQLGQYRWAAIALAAAMAVALIALAVFLLAGQRGPAQIAQTEPGATTTAATITPVVETVTASATTAASPTPLSPTITLATVVQGSSILRPTATLAAAPTITLTPTARAAASHAYQCTVLKTVNFRKGPGGNYSPPLGELEAGMVLYPSAYYPQGYPSGAWVQAESPDLKVTGWVRADAGFIQCNTDIKKLPFVVVDTPVPLPQAPERPPTSGGDNGSSGSSGPTIAP